MTTHFLDLGSFVDDQCHDAAIHLSETTQCSFCFDRSGTFVNLGTCTHLGFLEGICSKVILETCQDMVVCLLCHRMLVKCNTFTRHVEESIHRLSDRVSNKPVNRKLHNLKQVKRKGINIDPKPDYIAQTSTTELITSTDETEFSDIKTEATQEIKEEYIDSDDDNDNFLPLSEIKKKGMSTKSINSKTRKNKVEKKVVSKKIECKKVVPNIETKKVKRKQNIVAFEEKYQGKIKKITLSTPAVLLEMDIERSKEEYQLMPFKCEECVKGFQYEMDYNMHREKWHTRISGHPQCSICKRYWSSSGYSWHFNDHHTRYECTSCESKFNTLTAVISHYNSEHGASEPITVEGHTCHTCGASFATLPAFRYHMTKHDGRPQCMECGKTFINEQGLKAHMQRAHTESTPQSYICNVCGKKYKAKFNLKVHIASSHEYDSTNAPYCAKCNILFKHGPSLRNHLKTHSAHVSDTDKKFECSQCDRKFILLRLLKEHIEWDHLNKARFNCIPCEKRFKTKRNMQRHMDDVHKKIPRPKNKICDICGRGFGTARFLKIHMRVHTGERPLKCEFCTATFAHPGAQYKHKQLVHKVLPKKALAAAAQQTALQLPVG